MQIAHGIRVKVQMRNLGPGDVVAELKGTVVPPTWNDNELTWVQMDDTPEYRDWLKDNSDTDVYGHMLDDPQLTTLWVGDPDDVSVLS
jgi:hypothetical protein